MLVCALYRRDPFVSPFRSSFDGENQRSHSPMRGSLDRFDRNVQISLRIDLLYGRIQRSLAQISPDR
jgi:hypothetical protein